MTHELKIQKQWADAKLAGEKPFEIRLNDRGFQKGDLVNYTVVDPKTSEGWRGDDGGRHPLEKLSFRVTYVMQGFVGIADGYCVYADEPVSKAKPFVAGMPRKLLLCASASAHAREGSKFMCTHLATDAVHCGAERGACKCQEPEKPEPGFETVHPSP